MEKAIQTISTVLYTDPASIQELRTIKPVLNIIKDNPITSDFNTESQLLLSILESIQKQRDIITSNKSIQAYITERVRQIYDSITNLKRDHEMGKQFPVISADDSASFLKMRPTHAIISQLESDKQYSMWLTFHLTQIFTLVLFATVCRLDREPILEITNFISVLLQKYSWLNNNAFFEFIMPFNRPESSIFRSKIQESLTSKSFQIYALGSSHSVIIEHIKTIILQSVLVQDYANKVNLGTLRSKLYIRLIQQFALAPYFDEYKEYKLRTSATKMLELDLNIYVKETNIHEFIQDKTNTDKRAQRSWGVDPSLFNIFKRGSR